jgi:hypothetical protein
MASGQRRSVRWGLSSAACALALWGCSGPAAPARTGALELHIDTGASYALVGRFHVNAIEPWAPSRDIDFDATTSRARVELPPGTFALALGAGARLVCEGEEPEPLGAASAIPRLVSASPRVISITAGELTTAHISFEAGPAQEAALAPADAASYVPGPTSVMSIQ